MIITGKVLNFVLPGGVSAHPALVWTLGAVGCFKDCRTFCPNLLSALHTAPGLDKEIIHSQLNSVVTVDLIK
jgi:hypothetical protein